MKYQYIESLEDWPKDYVPSKVYPVVINYKDKLIHDFTKTTPLQTYEQAGIKLGVVPVIKYKTKQEAMDFLLLLTGKTHQSTAKLLFQQLEPIIRGTRTEGYSHFTRTLRHPVAPTAEHVVYMGTEFVDRETKYDKVTINKFQATDRETVTRTHPITKSRDFQDWTGFRAILIGPRHSLQGIALITAHTPTSITFELLGSCLRRVNANTTNIYPLFKL